MPQWVTVDLALFACLLVLAAHYSARAMRWLLRQASDWMRGERDNDREVRQLEQMWRMS